MKTQKVGYVTQLHLQLCVVLKEEHQFYAYKCVRGLWESYCLSEIVE